MTKKQLKMSQNLMCYLIAGHLANIVPKISEMKHEFLESPWIIAAEIRCNAVLIKIHNLN